MPNRMHPFFPFAHFFANCGRGVCHTLPNSIKKAAADVFAIPIIGFIAFFLRNGKDMAMDQINVWWDLIVIPAGVLFVAILLFNCLIYVPAKAYFDVKSKLAEDESLSMSILDDSENGGVTLTLLVRNRGRTIMRRIKAVIDSVEILKRIQHPMHMQPMADAVGLPLHPTRTGTPPPHEVDIHPGQSHMFLLLYAARGFGCQIHHAIFQLSKSIVFGTNYQHEELVRSGGHFGYGRFRICVAVSGEVGTKRTSQFELEISDDTVEFKRL